MVAEYPVRPIEPGEFNEYYAVAAHVFHSGSPSEPERQHERSVFEFDRSLAAFDQDSIVATACAYSFQMTVPGAIIPVAGVSLVAVLPTHRRRGLLSTLMRQQLADIRGRGEAVAALFASEPGIYGRYGYGLASAHLALTIPRGDGQLSALAAQARPGCNPAGLRLRITEAPHPVADLARVYEAVRPGRPGLYARDDNWWEWLLTDPEHSRDGSTPLRCVVASDAAGARGYAVYQVQASWDSGPASVLTVRELLASDPAAYAMIWSDLVTRDLVREVRARLRPLDDPLPHFLADRSRVRAQLSGGLWVRLIDVPAALAQRRYAGPVDVVIEVTDDLLDANAGRWRLRAAGPDRPASCQPASAPADVALPVQALGAAYLGGTRLGELASAGLVAELRPGTLAALSTALSWDPVPWCARIF